MITTSSKTIGKFITWRPEVPAKSLTPKLEMDGLLSLIMRKDSTNDSLLNFSHNFREFSTFGLFTLVVQLHVPCLPDEQSLGEDEAEHGHPQPRLHNLTKQFSPMSVIFCFACKHFLQTKESVQMISIYVVVLFASNLVATSTVLLCLHSLYIFTCHIFSQLPRIFAGHIRLFPGQVSD